MSLLREASYALSVCFPRVSGDEPRAAHMEAASVMFSPRERG